MTEGDLTALARCSIQVPQVIEWLFEKVSAPPWMRQRGHILAERRLQKKVEVFIDSNL